MKLIGLLLSVMLIATSAYGLTAEEEVFVKQLLENKQKLINLYQRSETLSNIADTSGSATLPLELEVLINERADIISARDAEIAGIKQTALDAIDAKMAEYEPSIDAKESEIQAKKVAISALSQ